MKKKSFAIVVVIFSALLLSFPVYSQEGVETIPFQMVEQKPSFNGGDANDFSKWVNEHIVYPESAKTNNTQGRVTLQFTVGADGSVTNVRVLRGLDPDLDKEAVRVISSSPKWNPGRQNGQPVNVTYMFPVVFSSSPSSAITQNSKLPTLEEFAKEAGVSPEQAKRPYEMLCAGANVTVNGIKFKPETYGIKQDYTKIEEVTEKYRKETEAQIAEQKREEQRRLVEKHEAEEHEALKRRQEAQSSTQQTGTTKQLAQNIPPKAREWTVEDTLPAAGTRRWSCKLYSDGTCTVRRGGKVYEGTWTYESFNEWRDLIIVRYNGEKLGVFYERTGSVWYSSNHSTI